MTEIKLTGKKDIYEIAEKNYPPSGRNWSNDSESFQKILDDSCDLALRIGMLEALDSMFLNINVVDGKPEFTAYVALADYQISATKILDNSYVQGDVDCDMKLRFDYPNNEFTAEKAQ
mgnify:CR=1 FL=1